VLVNLITNAAHAVAATNRRGAIDVHLSASGNEVTIAIRDTGTGIPREAQPRVFDHFFTTKDVGKGSGQGLAIARAIVLSHDGEISFETAEGVGTTFVVKVPARRSSSMELLHGRAA
jgi:signal transduction histidine kinase